MSPDVTLDIRGTGCVAKPRSMGILVDAVPHLDADGTSVSVSSVQAEHGWEGADFDRSKLPGLQIRGTFVHGDVDTGAIRLVLHRGDRLLYRTGPSTSRQTYRIGDGRLGKGYLPQAQTWSALVFDDPALPDQFELTLSDEGGSWGEWMAIALKSQPGGVSQ